MKATELQIGDWVQIVEPCKYAGAIGRIKTLLDHKDDENAYFKVFLQNNTIHIGIDDICSEDIRPIPLEKIHLDKNGFEVRDGTDDMEFFYNEGYEVKTANDGVEGLSFFKMYEPDLVLLDIMLPGEDGLEILKKLRSSPNTEQLPVILATARGSEYDKVVGLDTGADDYLAKPFGMMEMVSRIRAVLRRTARQPSGVLSCGGVTLDEGRHTVTVNGRPVSLTLKEYELLKLFLENIGQVFSREALLTRVWDADYVGETRTVDVHVGTLRTKLAECGGLIETVRGVGYKMEGAK